MTPSRPGWRPLAALLAGAGVLHFTLPKPYARIVPRWLGDPYPWVYVSGAAELACAAALLRPASRRLGALAAAGLFVAMLPGNITMAVRAARCERATTGTKVLANVRLPLQGPLVWWALDVATGPAKPGA
jgi:uncharacterized membrane protein